ncbi:MAG TPA: NADAR family protein [Candidatus Pristimantibacillus sp.]|jgi:ribA/ribD-fused uncharacterized protein|nr:NADAR family protein [Candidatus Pristimantibacillus sp.]
MSVERFRGEHFFLSNMYPLAVPISSEVGLLVPTSEHAYQSAKFVDPEAQYLIASLETGKEAKRAAHRLEEQGAVLRADWDVAKAGIMLTIVRDKFTRNADIAEMLLATGNEELVEGNPWGDRFWGVDPVGSRNGLNHMGKILMIVRDELKPAALAL